MENELLNMKRNALMLGLCGEYKGRWDDAKDRQTLIDIATDANGIEFLSESCADGWGLSTRFLKETFGEYINGNYVSRNPNGYTSQLYVDYDGSDISCKTTLLLLIDCHDLTIHVPAYHICKIYLCRCTNIVVDNQRSCDVYLYGENEKIEHTGNKPRFKQVKRGSWAGLQNKEQRT